MKHDFSAVIRARRNALGMNQSRLAEIADKIEQTRL